MADEELKEGLVPSGPIRCIFEAMSAGAYIQSVHIQSGVVICKAVCAGAYTRRCPRCLMGGLADQQWSNLMRSEV